MLQGSSQQSTTIMSSTLHIPCSSNQKILDVQLTTTVVYRRDKRFRLLKECSGQIKQEGRVSLLHGLGVPGEMNTQVHHQTTGRVSCDRPSVDDVDIALVWIRMEEWAESEHFMYQRNSQDHISEFCAGE